MAVFVGGMVESVEKPASALVGKGDGWYNYIALSVSRNLLVRTSVSEVSFFDLAISHEEDCTFTTSLDLVNTDNRLSRSRGGGCFRGC